MTTLITVTAAWDIGTFMRNLQKSIEEWGGTFILIVGLICMIASVYQIAMAIWQHGKGGQTNWLMPLVLLLFGGLCFFGGLEGIKNIAQGGNDTINAIGNQTVIPMFFR